MQRGLYHSQGIGMAANQQRIQTICARFASNPVSRCTLHTSKNSLRAHQTLSLLSAPTRKITTRTANTRSSTSPMAMVNVDVSPSVILGVGLIGSGVFLWQVRQSKPWISKDYDVVISCIALLVGGILIFQGWRLDPLLLFGQLMTTGAAVSFGIEALRLRSEVYEQEEKAELKDAFRRKGPGGGSGGASLRLPPAEYGDDDDQRNYGQPSTSWGARPWDANAYDYDNESIPAGSYAQYGYDDGGYYGNEANDSSPSTSGGQYGYDEGYMQQADYYEPRTNDQYNGYDDSNYDDQQQWADGRPSEVNFPPPPNGDTNSGQRDRSRSDILGNVEDWD